MNKYVRNTLIGLLFSLPYVLGVVYYYNQTQQGQLKSIEESNHQISQELDNLSNSAAAADPAMLAQIETLKKNQEELTRKLKDGEIKQEAMQAELEKLKGEVSRLKKEADRKTKELLAYVKRLEDSLQVKNLDITEKKTDIKEKEVTLAQKEMRIENERSMRDSVVKYYTAILDIENFQVYFNLKHPVKAGSGYAPNDVPGNNIDKMIVSFNVVNNPNTSYGNKALVLNFYNSNNELLKDLSTQMNVEYAGSRINNVQFQIVPKDDMPPGKYRVVMLEDNIKLGSQTFELK